MGGSRIAGGAAGRQAENKPGGQYNGSQSPALEGILHFMGYTPECLLITGCTPSPCASGNAPVPPAWKADALRLRTRRIFLSTLHSV